jgi:hypothetical protein
MRDLLIDNVDLSETSRKYAAMNSFKITAFDCEQNFVKFQLFREQIENALQIIINFSAILSRSQFNKSRLRAQCKSLARGYENEEKKAKISYARLMCKMRDNRANNYDYESSASIKLIENALSQIEW